MSSQDANPSELLSRSPEQTWQIGKDLGSLLQLGDLICLQGELGAGKTTLAQGIAQGWGSQDPASSPTFVFVNVYRRLDSTQMFHLDCYRMNSVSEANEMDIDTMLMQGPLVIEWPERIKAVLPNEWLWIIMEYTAETHRAMHFEARGKHHHDLLKGFIRIKD